VGFLLFLNWKDVAILGGNLRDFSAQPQILLQCSMNSDLKGQSRRIILKKQPPMPPSISIRPVSARNCWQKDI
jgi:hypothetical protein